MIPLTPQQQAERINYIRNNTILGQMWPQMRQPDEEVIADDEPIPDDAWESDEQERGEC